MHVNMIEEKKHKNGDVTFSFDIDKEFKNAIKKKYNKKRFTEKLGKLFIIQVLQEILIEDLEEKIAKMRKLNKIK